MEIMEADVMVATGNVRKALSYHKFSGMNNGKPDDFSDVDREKLKGALYDIADRLRKTADTL